MPLFGCITTDSCVQENDKFKIDASKSYVTAGEPDLTVIEIDPGDGSGSFDVLDDQCLEYQYAAAGTYTILLTIDNGTGPVVLTQEIVVKTEEEDCLLSDDECLKHLEPSICKYLPCERCSFKFIHRKVSQLIENCFREWKLVGPNCTYLGLCDLKDSPEIQLWATYWALELIFEGLSNQVEDVFHVKAMHYKAARLKAGNIGNLSIDTDGDGTIEVGESRVVCRRLVRK